MKLETVRSFHGSPRWASHGAEPISSRAAFRPVCGVRYERGPVRSGGQPLRPSLGRGLGALAAGLLVPLCVAVGGELGAPVSPPLSITRTECARGCATLDFVSPGPRQRHRLEQSADLRHWEPIPVATFTEAGESGLRTTLVGVQGAATFYRLELLESEATNAPVYVNLQVDGELDDVQGLRNVTTELTRRGITASLYVTADYANRNALLLSQLFQKGFEIALHGYYTGEQLASMTYAEQKDLLSRAKVALEGCRPCGTYKPILGFRPQYFSQNADTYRVLDELGLTYNSGFKVGQLYLPGYTWAARPYPAAGYRFHVLPISTVGVDRERVYLCDIACAQVLHWTPDQWRRALLQGLAESLETRQPLVVLLHGYYSGDQVQYGYWQPLLDFLDAAQGQVTFVQSAQLVEGAKASP